MAEKAINTNSNSLIFSKRGSINLLKRTHFTTLTPPHPLHHTLSLFVHPIFQLFFRLDTTRRLLHFKCCPTTLLLLCLVSTSSFSSVVHFFFHSLSSSSRRSSTSTSRLVCTRQDYRPTSMWTISKGVSKRPREESLARTKGSDISANDWSIAIVTWAAAAGNPLSHPNRTEPSTSRSSTAESSHIRSTHTTHCVPYIYSIFSLLASPFKTRWITNYTTLLQCGYKDWEMEGRGIISFEWINFSQTSSQRGYHSFPLLCGAVPLAAVVSLWWMEAKNIFTNKNTKTRKADKQKKVYRYWNHGDHRQAIKSRPSRPMWIQR